MRERDRKNNRSTVRTDSLHAAARRLLPDLFSFLALLALASLASLTGCASGQNIPPPGGPPDTTAPGITSSLPADASTNFSGESVEITFNEYVQETSAQDQIVITPIPERPPNFNWSGRTLEIEFREPLLPNRTYAISVGGNLTDLSGNRLGRPFTLRFSTGPTIDSGRIAGRIYVAGAQQNLFVYAWRVPDDGSSFDTLNPETTRPDFIAPADQNGQFTLETLPPGTYRIAAVSDEYADRRYTAGQDAFGVAPQDVTVGADYAPVYGTSLRLHPPVDIAAPLLYSATSLNATQTEVRFSEPIDTATIVASNFRLAQLGADVTVENAWRSPTNALSIVLRHGRLAEGDASVEAMNLRDTLGAPLADTARTTTFAARALPDTVGPNLIPIASIAERGYTLSDTLRLIFSEGVRLLAPGETIYLVDTAKGDSARFRLVQRSPVSFDAILRDTLFRAPAGRLVVDTRIVEDLGGNRGDSIVPIDVVIRPPRQRGTLQGRLVDTSAPNAPHVIMLESTEGIGRFTIRMAGTGAWELKDMPSGEYRLSAWRDVDGDQEYDFGSLSPWQPGEAYVEVPGGVRVRPRWTTTDVEIEFGR